MMYDYDFIFGWLRGFFDGEGHIQFLRKEDGHRQTVCRLYVGNTDPSLIQECTKFLSVAGIEYKIYHYKKKPPRKPLTTIYISRHDSLLAYAEKIGFSSSSKSETLKNVCDYINSQRKPTYSEELLRELYIDRQMSLPDICRYFGKHSKQQWYFSKLFKQYGIPLRSKSEAVKIALAKKSARSQLSEQAP